MSEDQPTQTIGDLQGACEEFPQTEDSDVFLVAVSELVGSGRTEEAAATLLREENQAILLRVGWDLLILLAPHLHSRDSLCWSVLRRITELCPPKEMSLALLEQMELTTDSTALFLMLELLQKVILGLQRETAIVSCLRSASRLLQRSYHQLEDSSGDRGERWTAKNGSDSETTEDSNSMELESGDCDGQHSTTEHSAYGSSKALHGECAEEGAVTLQPPAEGQASTAAQRSGGGVTLLASQALQFIGPFVEEIHQLHCSATPHICSHWSPRQRQCISLLLSLLDYPLVQYDLTSSGRGSHENRSTAEAIMDMVVRCHCGCVELLGWTGGGVGDLGGEKEATEESEVSLPPVGLSCFAYLLLSEGLCASYLPAVVRGNYLLQISINHTTALLQRPEKLVILKGLSLLETLIGRVCPFSLPSHLLDDKQYLSQAELLTNLMVTCPHKTVRRQSVPLLLGLVKCFSEAGRYRMYQGLLRSTGHAGVLELLIHSIKNEIDQALKVGKESLFVGSNPVLFLDRVMSISSDMDLMKESNRVMAILNFLRYLLIRDTPQDNQTGIWTTVGVVREKFTTPLRQLLMATKAHCRHELKVKQGKGVKGAGVRSEGGTEVTVEVMGEKLPDVMPEDEIEALQVAEQHLAMMESVLVRVEELMESTQSSLTTETRQ